jgi:DNA-binding protein Fis
MPEFNVDLSPKNQPTSLADLLKLQAYSYQGDVAQQEAAKAKQAGIEREIFQGFMKDGKWKNENGDIDLDVVNSTLPALMPLTGHEYAAKLNQLSKNTVEARDAQLNFDQKERSVVASVFGSLGNAGIQDPKVYSAALENLKMQFPNSKNIHRYVDSAVSNLKLGSDPNKPNPELPKNALLKSNEMLSLEKQYELASPKAALTTVGGQNVVATTTPSFGGSKPTIEVAPLGGGGSGNAPTPASTQTNKPSSKLPKLIPEDESLKYTPSTSGITNTNKFQDAAYERGNEIVKTANASLQGQANLQESIRKVEKHYQAASGSKVGQAYERTKQYLLGNEQLDTLKKSIAQVQAKNAELMGLNRSDASQQLNEKLSGNENIDPKALEGIMQQVKAESKAAEMFTKGINKYLDMRGDINGKIQAEKFKSKWSEHYDPRIFQVFNISESNIPETEKTKRIHEITSKMTTKEYDKYKKDSEIIHRLHQGAHQ